MIDLLIGLGLLPLLLIANYIVITLCKIFPKDILGLVPVMIGLDSVATLGYTFIAKSFVMDIKLLIGGVGISIISALLHKVLVMLKTFKVMFKNEIRK